MDILNLINIETIQRLGGEALSHQFTQMTVAFGLAAFVHSSRVKKEIRDAFGVLSKSIDNVADKVSNEINGIKKEIHDLSGRVDILETNKTNKP